MSVVIPEHVTGTVCTVCHMFTPNGELELCAIDQEMEYIVWFTVGCGSCEEILFGQLGI